MIVKTPTVTLEAIGQKLGGKSSSPAFIQNLEEACDKLVQTVQAMGITDQKTIGDMLANMESVLPKSPNQENTFSMG